MKIQNKEIALLHQPRTGGTSIAQHKDIEELGHMQIYDDSDPECKRINYTYYYHDKKSAQQAILPLSHVRQYYLLFITRNTFSWLVSYFDWVGGLSGWNNQHHDYIISTRGFDYFIKSIINRENAWPSRHYLSCQAFTPSGLLVPNYILHTENLDSELGELFEKWGGKYDPPPRMQQGRRHGNFGANSAGKGKGLTPSTKVRVDKRKPHEYYSDSLAEEVYKCWKDEFDMFGYSNDPSQLECSKAEGILWGEVSEEDRKRWKYVWEDDQR